MVLEADLAARALYWTWLCTRWEAGPLGCEGGRLVMAVEGGVVLMLTSFGMVRGVFLFMGLLATDPLLGPEEGGFSPLIGGPLSSGSDELRCGCAVKEIPSDGGLSWPLLPVSSLNACHSMQCTSNYTHSVKKARPHVQVVHHMPEVSFTHWNPSNMDTNGPEKSEVPSFQRFKMQEWYYYIWCGKRCPAYSSEVSI